MSSAFSAAFLRGEPRAVGFVADDFRHPEKRAACVHRASQRSVSAQTLAALRRQAALYGPSEARDRHFDALERKRTAVVVTGQQVGLFLGPLYTFYKAASAVAVARALECVPVFWLQSEDHDVAEIDHCTLQAADGALVDLKVAAPAGDQRRSVSSLTLGASVSAAVDALASALDGLPHANEVLTLFRAHYRPDESWVQAFARVLSHLFAQEGLIVVNPRDPALAMQAVDIHRRAIAEREKISHALAANNDRLTAEGFQLQIPLRADVPLSFVHPEGPDGPRVRGAALSVDNLPPEQEALCYSSSALLRPIIQDTLLPTAAVVVGPGELNYFAQLPPLYAHFQMPMPMVVPRARFRVVEARPRSLLQKLGLTAAHIEVPREHLLRSLCSGTDAQAPTLLERELNQAITEKLETIPQALHLERNIRRTKESLGRITARLTRHYARALSERDATRVARVDALQRALFPHHQPQERIYGLPQFASRFGLQGFKALVFSQLEPFDPQVKELEP